MSFVPMQTDWWADAVHDLLEWGGEWSRGAVLMDLRWWADQERMGRRKRPGRVALGKRWGWSQKRTRNAMKAESEWGDPYQTPQRGGVPQGDHRGATGVPDKPTKPIESLEQGDHRGATGVPQGAPRADLHKTQNTKHIKTLVSDKDSPSPCPDGPEAKADEPSTQPAPEQPDELAQLWALIQSKRKAIITGARRQKLTPAMRSALKARVKEHSGEEVVWVVDWWLKSPHRRAAYLRENNYGLQTILRPKNFGEYAELAYAEVQAREEIQRLPSLEPAPAIASLSNLYALEVAK